MPPVPLAPPQGRTALLSAEAAEAARATDRAATAAAAAAGGFVSFRDDVRKYYFVVDLIKKTLVAILTGGVLVSPFTQARLLEAFF